MSCDKEQGQFKYMQTEIVGVLQSKLRKHQRARARSSGASLEQAVFSVESTVLYNKMEADHHAYLAEFLQDNDDDDQDNQAKFDAELTLALDCYKTGMKAAVENLSPTDPLRLQLALSYSTCLYDLANCPGEAINLVKSTFDLAYNQIQRSDITGARTVAVTRTLQLIRDSIAFWESEQALADSNSDDEDDSALGDDDASWLGSALSSKSSKKHSSKSSKHSTATEAEEMESMEERCLSLMKVDPDLQLPLQVDSIFPSHDKEDAANLSIALVPALFELFSLYAEDKAPSALNVGNNGVLLGSNRERVDFNTFLLNAHKGSVGMTMVAFLKFAADFQLVPKLMDLEEVEALCRIAVGARRPVLMCGRRREGEKAGGWASGGGRSGYGGSNSNGALSPLKDSVRKLENSEIRLQHAHFVDCLARCALVSYSVPPLSRDYPTTTMRIEHFLCENLGLLNQSESNGWRTKVGSIDRHLRAQIKTRLPSDNKRLGYGRSGDSNASSSDFRWTAETEKLVLEVRFGKAIKLVFDSYRKLQSAAGGVGGVGTSFDVLMANAQQLQVNDFLKFASDFSVAPQLISRERLISLFQGSDKFNPEEGEQVDCFDSPRGSVSGNSGSGSSSNPISEYERLKSEMADTKFLEDEPHGYRVFADCVVRSAVEIFSKKEFRESGQFASQASKVLAFFYHLQLHESLLLRKKLRAAAARQSYQAVGEDGAGSQRHMLKSMSAAEITRHQELCSPQKDKSLSRSYSSARFAQ